MRIEVSLKQGHSDPEGETAAKSLQELGYPVKATHVSKVYTVYLSADSGSEARRLTDEMCRRLLANPTKDNYSFNIEEG
ncbi:MAG: phosphoribosylformylglycinamidine synthase subunit PurS [Candidatus Bathyarchaeota archaeon]|nr:MAG: phosphoribosylformylglycinamidine synthase subunit PurS [Candidatus Bathyarchaeota archaeon]